MEPELPTREDVAKLTEEDLLEIENDPEYAHLWAKTEEDGGKA